MNDWKELLEKLSQSDLDFFIVGGAALVLHGLPRTTLDIDIYIPANKKNFKLLFETLVDSMDLLSDQEPLRVHYEQCRLFEGQWFSFSNNKIDVIDVYLENENKFYEMLEDTITVEFYQNSIKLLSLKQIKKLKEEIRRPLDLADIALIDEVLEDI